MLESTFKKRFLNELVERLAFFDVELEIVPTIPHVWSFPDTIVLGPKVWAALEFKRDSTASKRPNQPYYVERLNEMGYSAFVEPGNGEEVMDDLERLFKASR